MRQEAPLVTPTAPEPAAVRGCAFRSHAPHLITMQEKRQTELGLREIHLRRDVRNDRCFEKQFLLNKTVSFSHYCGDVFLFIVFISC